jgi:hypothetical protein
MYRTFLEFVNQRDNEEKFRHKLLDRLGLDDDTIKISSIEHERLDAALDSMGLDDTQINNLHAWLKTAPESRVKDLVSQYGRGQTDAIDSDDQQLAGMPAQFPQQPPQNPAGGLDNQPPQQ